MLSGLIGETPDIAQTYGRTGRSQNDTNTASKVYSIRSSHLKVTIYYYYD